MAVYLLSGYTFWRGTIDDGTIHVTTTFFITGGTGFLGAAFIKQASIRQASIRQASIRQASENRDVRFYCLVRGGHPSLSVADRLRRALENVGVVYDPSRHIAVEGDIEQPGFGIAEDLAERIASKTNYVLHMAAMVSFLQSYDELKQINVGGTQNAVSFAQRCHDTNQHFVRFGHVGTAYVAGRRSGRVSEDDLTDIHGFKNDYERTKFEAEQSVRENWALLPTTIFRPSIIIGPAETSRMPVDVDAGQTLQPSLKLLLSGDYKYAPLNPDCSMDFIPVDDVARAIAGLLETASGPSRAFHLVSGGKYPYTLETYKNIVNDEYEHLAAPVRFVDPKAYDRHIQPALDRENPRFAQIVSLFDRAYKPYLMENPVFDDVQTQHALNRAGVALSDPAVAFRNILRRAARASASANGNRQVACAN